MTQQTNAPMITNPRELKPCPFCGSKASYTWGTTQAVHCSDDDCGLGGGTCFDKDFWQTRIAAMPLPPKPDHSENGLDMAALDAAIFDWENVEGPDFGATRINTGILRNFIKAAKAHRNNQPQVLSRGVPEGWVMVPIKVTFKMLQAFHDKAWPELSSANREEPLRAAYKAMLAATPTPPSEGVL